MIEDSLRDDGLVGEGGVIRTAEGAGVVTDRDGSVVQIFSFPLLLVALVIKEVVNIVGVLWKYGTYFKLIDEISGVCLLLLFLGSLGPSTVTLMHLL